MQLSVIYREDLIHSDGCSVPAIIPVKAVGSVHGVYPESAAVPIGSCAEFNKIILLSI